MEQQYTAVGKQGVLAPGVLVKEGQFVASPNGKFTAIVRKDGNFCLTANGEFTKSYFWNAGCANKGQEPYSFKLQKDGNLVVLDSKNTKVWESFKSKTHQPGKAPFRFVVKDNREMGIMDKTNKFTFRSNTALKEEVEKKPSVEGYFPVGINGVLAPEVTVKEQQYIASENDEYAAVLRKDGNLCLYPNGEFTKSYYWNAGCAKKGQGPYSLKLQKDGNLVVLDSKNTKIWESFNSKTHEAGVAPFRFVVQDDREMCILDKNNKMTFRSKTGPKKPIVEEEEEEEVVVVPPKQPEEQKKPNPNPEEQKKPNPVPQPKPQQTKEQQLATLQERENRLKGELQTLGLEKLMENVSLALGKTTSFAELDQAYFAQQQVIEGEKLKIHQQNQQRVLQAQAQGQNVAGIQEEVNNEYNVMSTELQAELANDYRNNQIRIQCGQGVDSNLDQDYQKAVKKIDNLMDKKANNLQNTQEKIAKLK